MLSSPGAENKGRKKKEKKQEHNATLAFNVIGNSLKKSGRRKKSCSHHHLEYTGTFSLQI